jgi:hypothetical protein
MTATSFTSLDLTWTATMPQSVPFVNGTGTTKAASFPVAWRRSDWSTCSSFPSPKASGTVSAWLTPSSNRTSLRTKVEGSTSEGSGPSTFAWSSRLSSRHVPTWFAGRTGSSSRWEATGIASNTAATAAGSDERIIEILTSSSRRSREGARGAENAGS